ncbi:MAG TPA: tetratricopeptide repeat protein [Candidatus Acidoferrum sp.]|jgi:tetratricopeptide (TPR) repeat protein
MDASKWNLRGLATVSYRILFFDEMEEYQSTIRSLTEYLKANPQNGIAYNNRGVAYSEIGQGEEALSDFEKAMEFSPDDPNPYMNRGDLYARAQPIGRVAEAIDDYARAISISPNNATFHRCMAHACLKINRLQEAVDSFTNAIRLDPKFKRTYIERGETFEKLGNKEKAQEDFRRARGGETFWGRWRRHN